MSNVLNGQDLIEAFFNVLRLGHLEQCEALLKSLETLSHKRPSLKPWCMYLQGIMVFELHNDYAEAERIFARLLQTDLEPAMRARVLRALGRSFQVQGRWEEAITTYEQSLLLFAELEQTIEMVKAWKQIAISYCKAFTQGDFGPEALQRAAECCQQALDALKPITDPPSDVAWLEGSVWNTLGVVYMNLGQWDDAIACYERDLTICRLLDDRLGMGLSYGNLGEIYQKRGRDNWPDALEAYQKALSLTREFDDRYEETEALANLGFLHQEMGEYSQALDYYGRAIDLIEDLRAGITSEEARAGFFATIADTYANMVLLCLEAGREEPAFNYVERARSRTFLDILAARSPDLAREMEATTMTLAEVQAALPADALLVEYFTTGLVEARTGRVTTSQTTQRHRFPPARTLIFAVTHDELQVRDAGISPNDLLPRRLDSVVERRFLKPEARRMLYDRLAAPVEDLLQGRRRFYLVPHGPLHYIPFQALITPDGDMLLREEGPQLIYAPSATLIFRYGRTEPGRAPEPCLALGYNGQGAARLHFAEEEARSIARLTGGQVLAGPSPKKQALWSQAESYRLLHFSCHGDFDPESPLVSAVHLAPGETLTALDIFEHLRLRCDLVTLSACESGLSRVRRGDELIGFIRAFMYAGAPALIATLWRVDERSTRILMERFYQGVQTGTGFAEALKHAQLYLRNLTRKEALDILDIKGSAPAGGKDDGGMLPGEEDDDKVFADPYYWAPFILVGDHGST